MKNFMVFNLICASLMLTTVAQAGISKHLFCEVARPCKNAPDLGGKCISIISFLFSSNNKGEEIITYTSAKKGNNVMFPPDQYALIYQVSKVKANGILTHKIVFRDETGDQWGQFVNTSAGRYQGVITIDQDFQFKASCIDNTAGVAIQKQKK